MDRLTQLSSHMTSSIQGAAAVKAKNDDDVVIVGAYRTAIAKGGKGLFRNTKTDELLAGLFKGLIQRTGVDPSVIGDVVVGNVLNVGAGAGEHRAAALAAGIPYTAPFIALNRQCSSGLMAVNDVANKIIAGQISVGLAAGVESMSLNYGPRSAPSFSDLVARDSEAAKCGIPMGITNENVAERYHLNRKVQDEFAAALYNKAENAIKTGLFKNEIIPIEVQIEVENDDDELDEVITKTIVVDTDEGPRAGVTAALLGKIKPAFKKDGVTHAGNASQVLDGAGAVLLARRSEAKKLGLPIVGKYVATSTVGVPPEIMGVGPAYAIPDVLSRTGLTPNEVSVYEINEAFAAQALYLIQKANVPIERVNPRGGAIAIGHPLGATGARQVATLMNELKAGEIGVTSMCIGTGMGAAAVFVKE